MTSFETSFPSRILRSAFRTVTSRTLAAALTLAAGLAAAVGLATPALAADGPPPGCQGDAGSAWINIVVDNVRSSNGLVTVTLYPDDSSQFLRSGASLERVRVPARAGKTTACVILPRTGTWVFAVYHDENGDKKFNRNAVGMPQEGFGFSNNPSTTLGIPAFRAVRLRVPNPGMETTIRLTYP